LLMLVGGQGLATVVVTKLTASLAAVLLATVPLWIAVLTRARGSAPKVLLGLGGVAIALFTAPSAAIAGSPLAAAACCVAAVLWAAGSVRSSRADLMPVDPQINSAIQLFSGGIVLLTIAAVQASSHPQRGLTRDSARSRPRAFCCSPTRWLGSPCTPGC
jgi:drug/metabolite transporter (DMT)-like permease